MLLRQLMLALLTCFSVHALAKSIVSETPMLLISGGEFMMGSLAPSTAPEDASSPIPVLESTPRHKVSVPTFYMGKYEVTVKQFAEFVQDTQYEMSEVCLQKTANKKRSPWGIALRANNWQSEQNAPSDFHPVMCIRWKDAQAYIAWLNEKTGKSYRLPSEAEWEYAAHASAYGSGTSDICQYANVYDKSAKTALQDEVGTEQQRASCQDFSIRTSIVGMYQANDFGLYDMHGNVREFVADCHHSNYENAPSDGSARGGDCAENSYGRVHHRGGSYQSPLAHLASHHRGEMGINLGSGEGIGFRLAMDKGEQEFHSNKPSAFERKLAKVQKKEKTKRKRQAKREALLAPIEPLVVKVPAGRFTMGDDSESHWILKTAPAHEVKVEEFYLAQHEITLKQFRQFVETTGYEMTDVCWKWNRKEKDQDWDIKVAPGTWDKHSYPQNDFHPVMCVSWHDAKAYVDWLSEESGKRYRLPTEAEWEYAARAGTEGKVYFKIDDNTVCEYANIFDQSAYKAFQREIGRGDNPANCDDGAAYTNIVGMYKPNPFGLYDMIGNVNEFVEDCEHVNYEGAPSDGRAWTTDCNADGRMIVHRGQGYSTPPKDIKIYSRGHSGRGNHSSLGEGFRIVLETNMQEKAITANNLDSANHNTQVFYKELSKTQQKHKEIR